MSTTLAVRRPTWLAPATLALCLLGLADAAYLTYEHFTGSTSLVCSESGTIDCAKVTTSPWSYFLGVPVSVLGLLFFAGMTAACLPVAWRRAPRWIQHARTGAAGVGLLMVLYLIWAELFKVGAICLWCTGVHLITFLLLLTLLVGEALTDVQPALAQPESSTRRA